MAFTKNINVFKSYSKSLFNFPKFHSMVHYISFIRSRGSLNNFMTEHFKHQYILDAKEPFRNTNKKDLIIQILSWLSQQDIVNMKHMHINNYCDNTDNSYGVIR